VSVDRTPLRSIALTALQGNEVYCTETLEAIFAFTWDQLAQRCGDPQLRAMLLKDEFHDLYDLASAVIADNPTHRKEA
jgi:hypothetical protein